MDKKSNTSGLSANARAWSSVVGKSSTAASTATAASGITVEPSTRNDTASGSSTQSKNNDLKAGTPLKQGKANPFDEGLWGCDLDQYSPDELKAFALAKIQEKKARAIEISKLFIDKVRMSSVDFDIGCADDLVAFLRRGGQLAEPDALLIAVGNWVNDWKNGRAYAIERRFDEYDQVVSRIDRFLKKWTENAWPWLNDPKTPTPKQLALQKEFKRVTTEWSQAIHHQHLAYGLSNTGPQTLPPS